MKESQHIEWKRSWQDEYLKWICGFANAQGGTLVIGRNDRGKAVGLPDAERLLEEIPNKVRDILGIMVEVNLHTENGNDLVEIVVEPYPSPISYKGDYYFRSGSTKQELKGAALHRFLMRKQGRHWDGAPIPSVSIADLDPLAFTAFRKLAAQSGRLSPELLVGNDSQLIEKLRLVENGYLTHAATLLFHSDPGKFTTGAYVKIGFFRTDSDLLYHDVIEGNLFTQAEKSLDLLLTKYLRAGISYSGTQRIERFPIPEAALREALINAIAHKDYASAIPIQISVYHNKLMLWNPGQLPSDWSLERLLTKHASQPANPDIANAFFRAGKIEAWGRGIDLIRNTCIEQGYPVPAFSYDSNGLWIEFTFPILPSKDEIPGANKSRETTPVKTPAKMLVKTPAKILQVLADNPEMTLSEVAVAIGKSVSAVERASANLVKAGRLKFVGPQKGGHWRVLE